LFARPGEFYPEPVMSPVLFQSVSGHVSPVDSTKLLHELCSQPELIARLLHTFQAETQKDIDHLEAAIAARDSAAVRTLAHRLKGSAATLGAESLRFRAAQIEEFGLLGDLEQASDQMPGLHIEFERFCSLVQEWRDLE